MITYICCTVQIQYGTRYDPARLWTLDTSMPPIPYEWLWPASGCLPLRQSLKLIQCKTLILYPTKPTVSPIKTIIIYTRGPWMPGVLKRVLPVWCEDLHDMGSTIGLLHPRFFRVSTPVQILFPDAWTDCTFAMYNFGIPFEIFIKTYWQIFLKHWQYSN